MGEPASVSINGSGLSTQATRAYALSGVTEPGVSAVLNADETVSADVPEERFGFPKPTGASVSYWQLGVQGDPLLHHRTTPELPQSADVVIIGSGMTGVVVAKHCLATWPEKSVVVLEAREFCSGATGRNAGHCKPDQYRGFTKYETAFGAQQALKILQNEQQTWSDLVRYIRENDVDCDLWVGETLDVPIDPEGAKIAHDVFERVKAAGAKVDHIQVTHDPAEAAEITRIKDAQACYAWPASTLYPWKLTAHIMRDNLKNGVNLQTHTQVTEVKRSAQSPERWIVESDRGGIECSQVVHATNAYSSALEPSLRGLVRPTPHICHKVVPPTTFRGDRRLQNSYGLLLPNGELFTINPRCTADGVFLFGGTNPGQQKVNKWLEEHPEKCTDDGPLSEYIYVEEAVQDFAEAQLLGWTEADTGTSQAESQNYTWSGIIARSADGVPFVGELPGLPGQWACVGHNGHGMARIFTAAPGLVKLMDGKPWADTQLPDVFQITPARIERLKQGKGQSGKRVGV